MVYRAATLRGLAIAQMVFGFFVIVAGITTILAAIDHWTTTAAFGIWVGFWVLISGFLGYMGAREDRNPKKCLIGWFMGFSITACVIDGLMLICYCFALRHFSRITRCRNDFLWSDPYCYPQSERNDASLGLKLGSLQLLLSILVFFDTLASSIYCCKAVCCGAPAEGAVTRQQVMYVGPQQMYPGDQPGVFVIQPTGAMATAPMATAPYGYPFAAGQQTVFLPPQQEVKDQERPPPYSYSAQTGNSTPSAASTGGVTEDVPAWVVTI